jgi:UDP-3-O-[3-hydroxymyristoyl] glucosamine N-acyltransferase
MALETTLPGMTLKEASEQVFIRVLRDASFRTMGFLMDTMPCMLAFAESARFLALAREKENVAALITTEALGSEAGMAAGIAVAEFPKRVFFELHNLLVSTTQFYERNFATTIHPGACIHPRAWVEPRGVRIGDGVRVGPNAAIHSGVTLAGGVSVRSGAVLGASGFQTCRCGDDLIELEHAGGIQVGEGAIILDNAVIASGVFRQDTAVGAHVRVGAAAFISHNVEIGAGTHIGHGAVVNGNVKIGARAWVGPGAVISNNLRLGDGCHVSLGSVVIRDVGDRAHVSGNFAISHRRFLRARRVAER